MKSLAKASYEHHKVNEKFSKHTKLIKVNSYLSKYVVV